MLETLPYDLLFRLVGLMAGPFWVLMILAPHWHVTRRVIRSPWIVAPTGLLYVALVLPLLGPALLVDIATADVTSMAELFGTPYGTTIAWASLTTWDLFAGRWIYLDGHERAIHPLLLAVPLFLTMMVGPVGFMLYLGGRRFVSAEASNNP